MANLQVSVHPSGDAWIVGAEGVIETDSREALAIAIDRLLADARSKIVVNLSKVTFVSSAGWGMLISYVNKARTAGGGLVLAGLHDSLRLAYSNMDVGDFLPAYPSIKEAAGHWKAPRQS